MSGDGEGSPRVAVFETLRLWIDPVPRSGPEAMAVDEWLLETVSCPVLRVYSWAGDWVSIGYFGKVSEARELFPGVNLVRRWTGGGIVDHRSDWTYTLVVPRQESLALAKGAESYKIIHEKLSQTLDDENIECFMSLGSDKTGSVCCFENPVDFDLVGKGGEKLAGAGQRRSRSGLLHQGSVFIPHKGSGFHSQRAENFAARLAHRRESFLAQESAGDLAKRVQARYSCLGWTNRR